MVLSNDGEMCVSFTIIDSDIKPLSKVRFLRPEIKFRAESSSLLKQASASSRAIYRSALKNQG